MRSLGKCQEKLDKYRIQGLKLVGLILLTINHYPAGTKSDSAFATSVAPGQPAHLSCLTILYPVGWPTSYAHFDIPKIYNRLLQKWANLFKDFSRLRVNNNYGNCNLGTSFVMHLLLTLNLLNAIIHLPF